MPFPADTTKPVSSNSVSLGSELSDELKSLLADLNKVVIDLTSDDDDEDESVIQFHANSCSYLNCDEFNSIVSKTPSNFSAFHLNIASMSKHFDKLGSLLAQLKSNFSFIGISKTRSLVDDDDDSVPVALEQKQDFPIPGYEKFFTPTESSAGGVSLYVSKCLSYKPRNDLKQSFYLAHNLEAVFVEIIQPNQDWSGIVETGLNLIVKTLF